ncbi:MAG: RNA polymerase sigma-54 factor [Bacteroidia bacterium]|nr:MAG: RNA polymerase sigma-54 factor [Bacteroidia bacterium]PIE86442.1 MAG: RNA polymerase sigma-54 factor [Bacteroidia bacterium]
MLKQKLQQKLSQKLSPQQIQLIKLLEVPTIQLEQRIKKEIEENPVLEEGMDEDLEMQKQDEDDGLSEKEQEEFTLDDYLEEEETPNYKLTVNNYSKDDKREHIPYSEGSTFREHMLQQLGLRIMPETERLIAEYIMGNIDDDGYLRRDLDAIIDDLDFNQNIKTTYKEVLSVLRIIQEFDPVGVGARDLQECLLIQIKQKMAQTKGDVRIIRLAKNIICDYFNEFTKKHYDKIINRLNISEADLKAAIEEILKLNPKPGSSYHNGQAKDNQHIIPDFILEVNNGEIHLALNSKNSPELRVNRTYANMLQTYHESKKKKSKHEKEAILFVKQKLDSAKWFIDAIKQRQNTLMITMRAIVEYQNEYFLDGDEKKLKPMILKDIAGKTKLDISTISRVANSKYIQTHFGIYPLKYFFSEGMQTSSGEEVSTREIKKILQDCIEAESKRKPLTDEKLAKILQEKGYQIARRTVAKYREQLNIPVARLRKQL